MISACRFLTTRLQLKVNESKSAVARSGERKLLGFTIANEPEPTRHIAAKVLAKFKARIRELTRRTLGVSLPQLIVPLARYLVGWRGYFGFCQTPSVLRNLDAWIRRRLRMYIWRQWKNGPTRYAQLRRLGVSHFHAAVAAGSESGYWRMARHVTVQQVSVTPFEGTSIPVRRAPPVTLVCHHPCRPKRPLRKGEGRSWRQECSGGGWCPLVSQSGALSDCNRHQDLRRLLTAAFAALPPSPHVQVITIPGIGEATAAVLVAKIVDIHLFATPNQLVNYFGVFPEDSSSGVDKHGHPLPPGTMHMSRKGNDLVRSYLWNVS